MHTLSLPRTFALVLIASTLLLSQQPAIPASTPQTNTPAHEEPANPASSPSPELAQQGTISSQANEPGKPPTATPKPPLSPQKRAWQILNVACTGHNAGSRAIATRVLGLIPNNLRARKLAERGLVDDKPEVRAAAATALGEMKSRGSIPKLREALDDDDPAVALAAAHSLDLMHDDSAYEVYYEILTGQRKSGKGLIASQTAILKDPKKMAQLGFEEGIGFIPFAGIGWEAIKVIRKDDSSPIRAAAAKVLANDPDPAAAKALADAAGDKSWLVRAAALEALAKRGDPSMLDTVQLYLSDEKDAVKCTAAAAVVRLTAVRESGLSVMKQNKNDSEKKRQK
jgi:HEAT repeat protein